MPLPTRAQVVVVGAGLAGLSEAVRLRAAGVDVHVAEAAAHAGGRLATQRVDGFVVDRGFQVLNTGYPRAADLDLAALDLGWFWAGAVVRVDGRQSRLVDPRRRPTAALDTLRAPIGSPVRKAAIAAYSARAGYTPVERLLRERETTAEERLRQAGVGDTALERFFRPFLAGVLLEDRLETSSHYLDLLWRSFARGAIGLPARGMQSVGEQLAARVGADRVHLPSVTVPQAQPAAVPPLRLRQPVDLGGGLFVAGDHRDTPSIQGAMASGARAARAVLRALGTDQ